MARPTRVDFPGARYHVLNRGIERRTIFPARRCYDKFVELLSSLPKRFGVQLHGYILMGNHYHLRLESREANLSQTIHGLPWQRRICKSDAQASTRRPRSTDRSQARSRRGAGLEPNCTVSIAWNRPCWEELLSACGDGARETALFIGRTRARLSLKELGQLAGGMHHNAVGIAIRRFAERLENEVSLVQKALELR